VNEKDNDGVTALMASAVGGNLMNTVILILHIYVCFV
jgi:hypothetical protein